MAAIESAIQTLAYSHPDQSEQDYMWAQELKRNATAELAALTARLAAAEKREQDARELLSAEVDRQLDEIEHYRIGGAPTTENEWLTKAIAYLAAAFLATESKP